MGYNKTNWVGGQTVATADIMNKIEGGIEQAHSLVENLTSEVRDKQSYAETGVGYKELPGGLILQWGHVGYEWDDSRDKIVPYPIPFKTFCFSHVASVRGIDNNWSATVNSHALDNTKFRCILSNNAEGFFNAVFWIAIGI